MVGDRPAADFRLLVEEDIPWIIELSVRRYGKDYDYATTEGWFRNIVLKQPVLFHPVRTEHAFCISMLSVLPWMPHLAECNVVFICADDGYMWEAMHLLRASIAWGRRRRCTMWRLSSETEYDVYQIAKRLGATEQSPRYGLKYT